MPRLLSALLLMLLAAAAGAQPARIRSLHELINTREPGWALVKDWVDSARNPVELLPRDSVRADSELYHTQVTTRSPMGAIVYMSGGILVDSGWIRILGSGCDRMNRSLMGWNLSKTFDQYGEPPAFLLIADDVLGGWFAINVGGIESANFGKVYYYAPDVLKWQNTELGYSEFLQFCFNGDLDEFYQGLRWKGWRKDVSALRGTDGIYCYPFLWSIQDQDIEAVNRSVVPVEELWMLNFRRAPK